MHFFKRLLFTLGGVYVVVVALAWVFQRRLQYFPDTHPPRVPDAAAYASIEELTLEAADGIALEAWYWPGSRDGTLLMLHGNAGHRGDRLDWAERFHALGWGVFLLDYRGYGGSGGSPTEEGLVADAEAAASWLADRGRRPVAYFGESIGCGVALQLALARPPAALILQSPFPSVTAVAQRAYPFIPVGLLLKDRFECSERIAGLRAPLLAIHGAADRIIPVDLGRALFDAAPEPKAWFEVPGGHHNDLPWVGGRAYTERIHVFLERHLD